MKRTWRHWVEDKYYEFKNFKVYWAYRHWTAEQIDKIDFPIGRPGRNGEAPLTARTNYAKRYK